MLLKCDRNLSHAGTSAPKQGIALEHLFSWITLKSKQCCTPSLAVQTHTCWPSTWGCAGKPFSELSLLYCNSNTEHQQQVMKAPHSVHVLHLNHSFILYDPHWYTVDRISSLIAPCLSLPTYINDTSVACTEKLHPGMVIQAIGACKAICAYW